MAEMVKDGVRRDGWLMVPAWQKAQNTTQHTRTKRKRQRGHYGGGGRVWV